jgi:hypothetical protein
MTPEKRGSILRGSGRGHGAVISVPVWGGRDHLLGVVYGSRPINVGVTNMGIAL